MRGISRHGHSGHFIGNQVLSRNGVQVVDSARISYFIANRFDRRGPGKPAPCGRAGGARSPFVTGMPGPEFQAPLEREAAWARTGIAFDDALANNERAVRELGDEVLKKIAIEITEKLHASMVDWQVRESMRAKLRILVRRCLQKWKYPPDQQANAVELVLKQAEEQSNSWTV